MRALQAGSQYSGPFRGARFHTAPDLQRLSRPGGPREASAALLSSRHFSAPELGMPEQAMALFAQQQPRGARSYPDHQPPQQQQQHSTGMQRMRSFSTDASFPMSYELSGSYREAGGVYGLSSQQQQQQGQQQGSPSAAAMLIRWPPNTCCPCTNSACMQQALQHA
jgi:hypothetical protein